MLASLIGVPPAGMAPAPALGHLFVSFLLVSDCFWRCSCQQLRLLRCMMQVPQELANVFASHDGLKGLQFDIPRTIDLKPTRTLLDFLPLVSQEKGI